MVFQTILPPVKTVNLARCNFCGTYLRLSIRVQTPQCPVCLAISSFQHYNVYNAEHESGYSMPVAGPCRNYYYQHPLQVKSQISSASVYGRKRDVLCGISYSSHGDENLKGSVNDVNCMKYFLVQRMGFPDASVLVLKEDESDTYRIPTKCNIQMALYWLIQDCPLGDSLVFHYSGHGSKMKDVDGDEVDGFDESLCPVDYKTPGKILDDETNATIVRLLPCGATLHAIFDTCFSGTILDLQHICRTKHAGDHKIWEDHRSSYGGYKGTSGGTAISISACDNNKRSGDTTAFTGVAAGVMTYNFIHGMENEPSLTYSRLLNAARFKIREAQKGAGLFGYNLSPSSQEPQLPSSEKFNIYSRPVTL